MDMRVAYKKRLLALSLAIAAVIVVDFAAFVFFHASRIVNWHSRVHPALVLFALAALVCSVLLERKILLRVLLGLYGTVTVAALVNQYLSFTSVPTYNCMLFNLVFFVTYLLMPMT